MVGKILVPLDGSPLAERIFEQLKRVLVRADAELLLVRVVPPDANDAETRVAHDEIMSRERALTREGARCRSQILVGDAAAKILELARELRPTLIAMSTHGRSGIARLVRGSVAERVLRASRVPLFLTNPLTQKPGELAIDRILVPLAPREAASSPILPLVAELARLFGARVALLGVAEVHAYESPATGSLLTLDAEVKSALDAAADRLSGLEVSVLVARGSPAAAILDAVVPSQDLVAMTTHGRTGVSRWVYGSVAEHVLRQCTAPLLVMRTGGEG